MERQRNWNSQKKFESLEKNKVGRITLTNFKSYYINQDSTVLTKGRTHINETKQNPEIDPHKHGQLIFDKGEKVIQ